MQTYDIPREWRDILLAIQTVEPRTIIAGGALRDLILGQPPKDIDIFIPADADVEAVAAAILPFRPTRRDMGMLIYVSSEINTVVEFHEYAPMDLNVIFDVPTDAAVPVNLIVASATHLGAYWLQRMDFGINQIGFDGNSVFATPAFWRDHDAKTFTYVALDRDEAGVRRSQRRAERFKAKYPEWTFVVPEVAA